MLTDWPSAAELGEKLAEAYITEGLQALCALMLAHTRQLCGTTRVVLLFLSSTEHSLLLSSASTSRERLNARQGAPFIFLLPRTTDDLTDTPSVEQDLQKLFSDKPEIHRTRFGRSSRSLLRLPVLREKSNAFYFMVWSERAHAFPEEIQRWFADLVAPLADTLSRNLYIPTGETPPSRAAELLGSCPDLAPLLRRAELAARRDVTVLITGETGTGKEVVADFIHESSPRARGPFVKINCGALTESLLSSLFFGYEKGAFTGADSRTPGYFEQAQGGTIFLDEVGELSPSAQAHLLRVLDRKEVQRMGSARRIAVDIRVIAATNRNLSELVRGGKFRADLWFRLNTYPLALPPLRERPRDILPLTSCFLSRMSRAMRISPLPVLHAAEIRRLQRYDFPGNVRELEHMVERALVELPVDATIAPSLRFIVNTPPLPKGGGNFSGFRSGRSPVRKIASCRPEPPFRYGAG